jgi:DNA polymerase
LVKPAAVKALGVTAARGLTGKTVTIAKLRGKPLALEDGTRLFCHRASVGAATHRG